MQLVHEWLQQRIADRAEQPATGEPWYLFGHCTETTALPASGQQWAAIFARFGAKLENVSVGCCGMAGTYGHEAKNLQNSLGIYELSWHPTLQRLPRQRCPGDRLFLPQPVKRIEGNGVRHPLQALLEMIE